MSDIKYFDDEIPPDAREPLHKGWTEFYELGERTWGGDISPDIASYRAGFIRAWELLSPDPPTNTTVVDAENEALRIELRKAQVENNHNWQGIELAERMTAEVLALRKALGDVRKSRELDGIGTLACNCGRLADDIAHKIDIALSEGDDE